MTEPSTPSTPSLLIVDGLEGTRARVELPGGTTAEWARSRLPRGAKEGDVIVLRPDGTASHIDRNATRARKKAAQAQLDALNAGDAGTDIEL